MAHGRGHGLGKALTGSVPKETCRPRPFERAAFRCFCVPLPTLMFRPRSKRFLPDWNASTGRRACDWRYS